ncbi:hypothetical protein Pyn_37389 [Prunus yedoensis var. nudiflora]|uniref:Uncharacterized protein n=1 Tax=Prunus yedoensis var. nudiflora TaxID=2094558 RepID=A0A314UTU1_PRUYE|nr:hypothetical protein Pyn_37389 [Prunus yedoensis var. nudiflora]
MEDIDEEELLNLSLAIVTTSRGERLKKRERRDHKNVLVSPLNSYEGCEGKIFRLLQMREQMLKLDPKKKGAHVLDEDGKGLHLIHMLLITATAVNENNVSSALENLNGLAARLLTRKSPFFDMIMKEPTSAEEFVSFTSLYRVSPYYQFAHFTANQAIIEAFEKEEEKNNRALHVIDFDVSYGFQWPSLIQSLSEKATSGNRISLRITGFGQSLMNYARRRTD